MPPQKDREQVGATYIETETLRKTRENGWNTSGILCFSSISPRFSVFFFDFLDFSGLLRSRSGRRLSG